MKKNIIRVGDRVRVIEPKIFDRCGYPKTLFDETQIAYEELHQPISNFLISLNLSDPKTGEAPAHTVHEIAKAIAYLRLKKNGYGGRERKIYTKDGFYEHMQDKEYYVTAVRFVKTGLYHPPRYTNWEGVDDYDPGYLENCKTHKLLKLNESRCYNKSWGVEIEECYVAKV